jgi:hypothetical protein
MVRRSVLAGSSFGAGLLFGALIAGLVVYFAVHQPTAKTLKDLKGQTDILVKNPDTRRALEVCGIPPVRGTCAFLAYLAMEDDYFAAISLQERYHCGVVLENMKCLDRELLGISGVQGERRV